MAHPVKLIWDFFLSILKEFTINEYTVKDSFYPGLWPYVLDAGLWTLDSGCYIMLCYVFFILIWRVIALYKNIQSN